MKKKAVILALLLFTAAAAFAQESEVISKIKSAAVRKEKVERNFEEVRNTAGKSKTVKLEGKLVYEPETKILMDYTNGEEFSIDGNTLVIDRDGNRQQFDTSKNIMMRGLSHAILYAFSGRMDELAKEQNAMLLTNSKDGKIIITLSAKAKAARGYSCIEVSYDSKTYALETMRMDEFTGTSTYYSYKK